MDSNDTFANMYDPKLIILDLRKSKGSSSDIRQCPDLALLELCILLQPAKNNSFSNLLTRYMAVSFVKDQTKNRKRAFRKHIEFQRK